MTWLQVIANAKALGEALTKRGYKLVTGGTDNHLVLWDLRPEGITGSKAEKACDLCHITLNKNAVVGDVSAMTPGGVRIGSPAMTSRGLKEADFDKIADFLHEVGAGWGWGMARERWAGRIDRTGLKCEGRR